MTADYFLKIDGIPGNSQNAGYKNQIQVFSFSFGASSAGTEGGGGQGAGKPNFSSFNFMKQSDSTSPLLLKALATGQMIKTATLSGQKVGTKGTTPFYTLNFTNVFITSWQESGSAGGDDAPTESISMTYQSITLTETSQNSSGKPGTPVSFTWNTVTESSGG